MNQKKINNYIETINPMFVEQGKYKCLECKGHGDLFYTNDGIKCGPLHGTNKEKCPTCNGSGIHANTSKLIMEIITQLVKALENWDKKADWGGYEKYMSGCRIPHPVEIYNMFILNTREDYLAYAMILLFNFAGFFDIELKETNDNVVLRKAGNIEEDLYCAILKLPDLNVEIRNVTLDWFFHFMLSICQHHNIDIEKHIDARLEYMKAV